MNKTAFAAKFFAAVEAAGIEVTEIDAYIVNDLMDLKSI